MAILIGTDEAGYGPSLGPLVITATAWQCSEREVNLYELLADVVTDSPKLANQSAVKNGTPSRILIADSKLASRSGGIGSLELPVLVLLHAAYGKIPKTLSELVAMVMPSVPQDFFQRHFWLTDINLSLPLSASKLNFENISKVSRNFTDACSKCETKLTGIKSSILLPPEFNAGVVKCGNKASLLSERTLGLVSSFIREGNEATLIACDKHGGRNYYGPFISQALTNHPLTTIVESPAISAYRWEDSDRQMEIRFTPKGEDQLPVALASMVSKYLREVFMVAWNQFWQTHLPKVKATKGYPQDAKRFLAEIEQVVLAEGYSRDDYLRNC